MIATICANRSGRSLLVRAEHVDDEGVVGRVVAADEEARAEKSGQEEGEVGDERDQQSKASWEEKADG